MKEQKACSKPKLDCHRLTLRFGVYHNIMVIGNTGTETSRGYLKDTLIYLK